MSGKTVKMRLAERRMRRLLRGIQQGWHELPRERVTWAYVADLKHLGVCVVEWRGQAPKYTPARRVSE